MMKNVLQKRTKGFKTLKIIVFLNFSTKFLSEYFLMSCHVYACFLKRL